MQRRFEPITAEIDMQDCTLIIDRKDEIEIIRDHIRQGKSLHIHGAEGVGKSALMEYVYQHWSEIGTVRSPIYCKESADHELILDTVANQLLSQGKKLVDIDYERRTERLILQPEDVATVPRRNLRNMVFPHIKRGKYCIMLDHLENVSQRTNSFLKALFGSTCIISASRESWDKDQVGDPKSLQQYGLWDVSKLGVKNLDKESAFNYMESLLHDPCMPKAASTLRLFEETYAVTQGNPKQIKTIIAGIVNPGYQRDRIQR